MNAALCTLLIRTWHKCLSRFDDFCFYKWERNYKISIFSRRRKPFLLQLFLLVLFVFSWRPQLSQKFSTVSFTHSAEQIKKRNCSTRKGTNWVWKTIWLNHENVLWIGQLFGNYFSSTHSCLILVGSSKKIRKLPTKPWMIQVKSDGWDWLRRLILEPKIWDFFQRTTQ